MKTTPEQRDRMAQAFQKSSHNKQLSAEKRLEARGQAKRWRILAKMGQGTPGPQLGQATTEATPAGQQSVIPGAETRWTLSMSTSTKTSRCVVSPSAHRNRAHGAGKVLERKPHQGAALPEGGESFIWPRTGYTVFQGQASEASSSA